MARLTLKTEIQKVVKIIKLVNGDDIVCALPAEQMGEKTPMLRLSKPLQVKYVPQITPHGFKDYVALIKWSPYTPEHIIAIPKDKIMSIVNASIEMTRSYNHVIKSYDKEEKISKRPNSVMTASHRLSDLENERLNEIFDEFEDRLPHTKRTLH